jgi:hypothetical protein
MDARQSFDRLSVERVCSRLLGQQCCAARVAAECPVRSAGLADLGELCERIDGTLRLAGANGSLDELRQRPDRQPSPCGSVTARSAAANASS